MPLLSTFGGGSIRGFSPSTNKSKYNYGTGANNTVNSTYNNLVYFGTTSATSPSTLTIAYNGGGNCYNLIPYIDANGAGLGFTQINTSPRQNILAGTNSYSFTTNAVAGDMVYVNISGGGLTSGAIVGSFALIVGGTAYTVAQAITNGYIEPLVLTHSGTTSGAYYFPTFENFLVGNTGSGNFPRGTVLFKAKTTITGVQFYSNIAFNTTYDGLYVYKLSTFNFSLSAF